MKNLSGDGHLPKRPRKSQNLGFLLSSQGISSSLILFQMILEALQSEIFGFKFDSLSSKILKFPGLNLDIGLRRWWRNHYDGDVLR